MIEFYQAYADYKDLMELTEQMLERLAIDILGTTDVPYGDEVYSFKGAFKKISMFDAILENNPNLLLKMSVTVSSWQNSFRKN